MPVMNGGSPLGGVRYSGGLGDEEAALGGALRVVHGGVRLRHVAEGPAPCQGSKNHSACTTCVRCCIASGRIVIEDGTALDGMEATDLCESWKRPIL